MGNISELEINIYLSGRISICDVKEGKTLLYDKSWWTNNAWENSRARDQYIHLKGYGKLIKESVSKDRDNKLPK